MMVGSLPVLWYNKQNSRLRTEDVLSGGSSSSLPSLRRIQPGIYDKEDEKMPVSVGKQAL